MKKRSKTSGLFYIIVLLLIHSSGFAQENNIEANFRTRLESVLILNVDPEIRIEFGLNEVNDNLFQITKAPDAINFSVESTENWNLSITASDPYFRGVNDPSQKIPVEFLGFYIENLGTNWDNGVFSNISNKTRDTVISLSETKTVVLANGRRNNIGGTNKNSFILRWKFMNEDNDLNLKEISKLNLKEDRFIGRFYLTLSESHANGSSINLPVNTETPLSDKIDPLVIKYLSNPISPRFTDKPEEKEEAEEIDKED
jgi:hypothetical protein